MRRDYSLQKIDEFGRNRIFNRKTQYQLIGKNPTGNDIATSDIIRKSYIILRLKPSQIAIIHALKPNFTDSETDAKLEIVFIPVSLLVTSYLVD